jgi:hypothetical protein
MLSTFAEVRAEALFASYLQASQNARAAEVREAVAVTLRRLGIRGCAEAVADEFGEHPDLAVQRMRWALSAVDVVYPTATSHPATARAA